MNTGSRRTAQEEERAQLRNFQTEVAALPSEQGVLLSDQIRKCVDDFRLIAPFREKQLKPASYRLTVGDRYALGGKTHTLEENGEIKIEPFQVAVIQTLERLNLPRNMIGRWNIKVKLAYYGLIWAGGPQVDPGFQGHLFCPIYNLSDGTVTLRYGDEIAVIDFARTTAFTAGACLEFPRPPESVVLEDYRTDWKSALHSYASERMKEMEEKIKNAEATLSVFIGITFAVMGVLVAALAVQTPKALWAFTTLLSLAAVVTSMSTLLRGTAVPSTVLKAWWKLFLTVLASAAIGGACVWWVQQGYWPFH